MASRESGVKRKRVNLSVAQKLELIKKLESGVSVTRVCDEYGVKKQTVSDIRKSKVKLQEYALKFSIDGSGSKSAGFSARKHMKPAKSQDLDEAVYKWYVQERSVGVKVRAVEIASAATDLAEHLAIPNFKASDGWLWRFRKRHGLTNLKTRGEAGSADAASVEPYRLKLNDVIKKEGLLMSQLYNADETGLYWRSLPKNTQVRKGEEKTPGHKMSKDRISAMCCANADGMHRLKLAVVGKSKRPRALKDYMHQLPVIYYNSKKAWFNSGICTDWFFKHFVPEVRRYQEEELKFPPEEVKALLLLDNAPAHPSEEKLITTDGKIRVMFLPPNTTSLIQPMDQGVISACKRRYQRRYLSEVLVVIEDEEDIENDTRGLRTLQKMKNYNLKSGLFNFASSWKDLKISTLANSWKKLLYDADQDLDFEGFEAADFHRILVRGGETEVTMDDVQEWLDENESDPGYQILSAEEIAAEVLAVTEHTSDNDDEEEMPPPKKEKLSKVREWIDNLISFVDATENRGIQMHYEHLRILREEIIREQYRGGKQLKIDRFFKPVTAPTSSAPPASSPPASPSSSDAATFEGFETADLPQPGTSTGTYTGTGTASVELPSSSDSE